jgi:hypothetical protein
LNKLSSADKYRQKREGDASLLRAKRVVASEAKPHGIAYSLVLIAPNDERLVCYDNAHPVKAGRGPGRKKPKAADHRHIRKRIAPYAYTDAETLMQDFWADVERVLKEEGVA